LSYGDNLRYDMYQSTSLSGQADYTMQQVRILLIREII